MKDEIEIKMGRLTGKGCLECRYTDKQGKDILMKGNERVHIDLKTALNKLVCYMADITEQKEMDDYRWDEEYDSEHNSSLMYNMMVTGVEVKSGNGRTVTLMGSRALSTNHTLSIKTPPIGTDLTGETYALCEDLDELVDNFFYECRLYIKEGKFGERMMEIDFVDDDDPYAAEATDSTEPLE